MGPQIEPATRGRVIPGIHPPTQPHRIPQLPPRDRAYSFAILGSAFVTLTVSIFFNFPFDRWALLLSAVSITVTLYNYLVLKIPFFPYDCILSATSRDGVLWEKEEGVRVAVGGVHRSCQVYWPAVISIEQGFRMYYRAGGYDSFIASAFSTDGLEWKEDPGVRIGKRGTLLKTSDPEIISVGTSGWRMYFAGYDGNFWRIYSARSFDGLSWQDIGVCTDVREGSDLNQEMNPNVVQHGTGWLIFFVCYRADRTNVICMGSSQDGFTWRDIRPCSGYEIKGQQVEAICVRRQEDGGFRMYFSEHPIHTIAESHISSAASKDGLTWLREEGVRVEPGGRYDRYRAFCPEVICTQGIERMYYCGLGKHWLSPYTLFTYKR